MSPSPALNLIALQPGERIRIAGGAVAEVVENPQDGFWVICRYLAHPGEPALAGAGEQPVFATDIEGYAP